MDVVSERVPQSASVRLIVPVTHKQTQIRVSPPRSEPRQTSERFWDWNWNEKKKHKTVTGLFVAYQRMGREGGVSIPGFGFSISGETPWAHSACGLSVDQGGGFVSPGVVDKDTPGRKQ